MKRPVWFHHHGFRWTPCQWQGWALIGKFVLFILAARFFLRPKSAMLGTLCALVVVTGIAALTDDTHQEKP